MSHAVAGNFNPIPSFPNRGRGHDLGMELKAVTKPLVLSELHEIAGSLGRLKDLPSQYKTECLVC